MSKDVLGHEPSSSSFNTNNKISDTNMTSERYFTTSQQTDMQGENLQKLMSSTLGLLSTLKNYTRT